MSSRIARMGLLALLIVGLARPAFASASFPGALRDRLELDQVAGAAPGCQLCHKDDAGGLKTATKPFGRSLLKAGAAAANVPSLLAALDRLESEGTDSDRDGTPDIAELKAGTDPNVAAMGQGTSTPPEQVPLPETGCALRAANATSAWPSLVLVVCVLWRRRRCRCS